MSLFNILKKFVGKETKKLYEKNVLLDTNVLFSSCFYPSVTTKRFFEIIYRGYFSIFLSKDIIDEFFDVAERKNGDKLFLAKPFLDDLDYILIPPPQNYNNIPNIRDEKDKPILAAAIANDIDYLITGDKDFLVLKDIIKKPKIFTMQEFIEKFS